MTSSRGRGPLPAHLHEEGRPLGIGKKPEARVADQFGADVRFFKICTLGRVEVGAGAGAGGGYKSLTIFALK